jgi:predicted DsbA family dithiol-disulfide isomerase
METVKFVFDPRCPWCFQANRWLRQLERLGALRLTWGLYCLEVANAKSREEVAELATRARSATALRTAASIAMTTGSTDGVGAFYKALGERVWETSEPASDRDQAVREAAVQVGFDAEILDRAMADPRTWAEVLRQHSWVAEERHAVGVPSFFLDGGDGPELFGPVLSHLPSDSDALEIWEHVRWLARYDNFFEAKRHRTSQPDVPGWKVPASKLTFGSRPWMPPVADDHVPTDGKPVVFATDAAPAGAER